MTDSHANLTSIWQTSSNLPTYEPLQKDIHVDVAIVGGGITGITTAYLLTQAGKKVAIIEADRICNGTTGHTTAKITAQHGPIYHELLSHLGQEKAKQYFKAQDAALTFIRDTVKKEGIECDFSDEDNYLYATSHHSEHRLEREYEAYQQLDIPGEWVTSLPINITIRAGLKLPGQAQFHPLQYLAHLCKKMTQQGAQIYEQTVCERVEHGNTPAVVAKNGARISASAIVSATHFPFVDGGGLYMSRLRADRSYVISGTSPDSWPGGMYLSIERQPRSVRSATINGETHLVINGESHKAGQGMDARKHYDALHQFADTTFSNFKTEQEWTAQDLITLDDIPYVGQLSSMQSHVYVATGYRKWGMTGGTMAAQLLTDLIVDGNSLYSDLFKPMRFHTDPSIRHFLNENMNVAKHLISGKLEHVAEQVDELSPGQGTVIKHNGKRAGAFRDDSGDLHLVDTTCTHMGCEVNWNHGDSTWDCPCHGSRFSYKGEVIEGPAKKPLKTLK
ncbi:FAD-dependent oxidoreductase [Shouchella shacheensis]|uniref:FAD-dependent oxidoreductase n=1 Tax=Shouchella shacheensis TaxID=1649580 RepID=UPI00073FDEFB|nr:FAD-dependent oxidoreductase [Shouchella shacheensis]